jgi:translation elongation factor EF-Tu-like GTPase
MENINAIVQLAKQLVDQMDSYNEKPTKAESKRIRATINDMQKVAVEAKRDMIKADGA